MDAQNVIETRDLTKRYRRYKKKEGLGGSVLSLFHREYVEKTAVSGMELQIAEGEFVGLIGPNGAGKTTLIKMLTGIIAPTSGQISVMGYYPNDMKNEFRKQYAVVMGQKSQLFFELTVNDILRMFKEIYEISEEDFQRNRAYFVELFGVKELMDVQVRTLSLGERMKMELIVALLHNPRVLFLDEPTIGLDAIASRQIRRFLKEINEERKTTILLTSHYMEDIRALCGRSMVIHHGKKIYDGGTEALFEKYQRNRKISVTFRRPVEWIREGDGDPGLLRAQGTGSGEGSSKAGTVRVLEDTPYKKVFQVPREKTGEVMARVMAYEPADITIEEEEVGKVIERIYREGEEADA